MQPEHAALAAALAALILIALRTLRRAGGRLAQAERALEAERDAHWEAREREERIRTDGAQTLAAALERAEAGARAKSRFLATVTHEMRTPLSGVLGAADLLLDTALAPDQRTYARAIKTSADAMLSLVDEILDLSRIEADRVVIQSAPFDVAEVVEGVAELLAPRAQAKGLDLAVRIAGDAPRTLVGDAARVRQILLNLAGNAVKFTDAGGVGLRVDADPDAVRFSVHDTGPGFPAGDAERLFGEFEQGAADPAAGGVGLGLAISRRLAHALGGGLAAGGAPGVGAIFTLTLPSAAPADAATPAEPAPLHGRRVAVVSAAPFGGPWLVEALREWGAAAELAPAGDAVALTARVAAKRADTVLIDRAAPGRAVDLAAAARRGGADRVLILLSPADRRELATLTADGFDGYLVKPIRAASMVSRLDDPRAALPPHPATPAATVAMAPHSGGLRVLLAEDDPVSALIALAHLGRLGHSVAHAPDGSSACALFEAEAFDVALLDLRMPGLDGVAAARRLRALEAASRRPRALLLALTANVSAEDRAAALAAGMDDLLPKPLDAAALATRLAARAPARPKVA